MKAISAQSEDHPLAEVFWELRKIGLALGTGDYIAVLEALRGGFGVQNRKDLEEICCLIWSKSEHDSRVIRRVMGRYLQSTSRSASESVMSLKEAISPFDWRQSINQEEQIRGATNMSDANAPGSERRGLVDSGVAEIDPVQVIQAFRHEQTITVQPTHLSLNASAEYLPISSRQMKQQWRFLRQMSRVGPRDELDIETTIQRIGKEWVYLEPALLPRRTNRAEVALFIDRYGSMAPFHDLSEQIRETAVRGGRLSATRAYYFHDFPQEELVPAHSSEELVSLDHVLSELDEQIVVLIVSDAGAARGYFDAARVIATKEFLMRLRRVVRYYAWVNPVPVGRWDKTTAGEISLLVPMFELSRRGLQGAISVLRGQRSVWSRSRLSKVDEVTAS